VKFAIVFDTKSIPSGFQPILHGMGTGQPMLKLEFQRGCGRDDAKQGRIIECEKNYSAAGSSGASSVSGATNSSGASPSNIDTALAARSALASAVLGIPLLKIFTLSFEASEIGFCCAEGFFLRKQEVTAKTGFDVHNVAHVSELFNTFEKDHFHGRSPSLLNFVGQKAQEARTFDGFQTCNAGAF